VTRRVREWVGLGGYRDSAAFFESTSADPAGTDPMIRALVLRVLARPGSTAERIWANDNASTRGWHWFWPSGAGGLVFRVADGGGAARDAQCAFTPVPGTTIVAVGGYSGGQSLARIGAVTGASAVGAAGVTAGLRNVALGVEPNSFGLPARSFSAVAAIAAQPAAVDAAVVEAIHDTIAANLAQGRDLDQGLGFALGRYWDGDDFVPGEDWIDRVAGQALAPTGAPQRFGVGGRV